MLAPGTLIDRYELVCHVGDGGMAHVWAARQRGLHGFEKLVALKIIHSRYAEDPSFRRMFIDEARIVSSLQHRNVAQVFDLGDTGSLLYLVMEYVDGDSLFALTAPQRTVPLAVALRIAADACAGLHAVQELTDANGRSRNVVHRDVSPQNVLLGSNGDVKLIDFGVAYAQGRLADATSIDSVKGKARYMAPEQARREPLGPFTDVFGIGATLFRMLAGRAPYAAEDDIGTMQALIQRAPPLHVLPADVPPRVADVVHRAIAPDVAARFANAREFGAALETLLASQPQPDLARFVTANLSEKAIERRSRLQTRAQAWAVGVPAPMLQPLRPSAPDTRAHEQAPDESEEQGPPGFMDVNALIARARDNPGSTGGSDSPDPSPDTTGAGGSSTSAGRTPKKAPPKADSGALGPSATLKLGVGAIVVVVVALLGALLVLPKIVRDRAVIYAREAGIELTVDRVGVGFGGAYLRDVTATIPSVPGVTANVQEVRLERLGNDIRLLGLDLTMKGRRSDLETGLTRLLAENRKRFAGTTDTAHHVSIVAARLAWEDDSSHRVLASDIGIELDSHGAGVEDLKGSVGRFEVKSGDALFGPWSGGFDRTATNARARVMFDPPVPDGPSALAVWAKGLPTQLTVKVPRSSFVNLGVKPSDLGIPANEATDVQIALHALLSDSGRSEFTLDAALWAIRPKGFSGPIDVRIEGGGSGNPGKPFDLEKTTVTVGPFLANVNGTLTPHDGDLRVDAMFKTVPMQCDRLVSAEAKRMGGWTATLEALGQATRALRVTGTVNASGIVKYDTATPGNASVTWLARETCGVSIFGM